MVTLQRSSNWSLVSSHGLVLIHLALHGDSTIREAAAALGLTERRVSDLIQDLSEAGLLHVKRCGRRNSYEVNQAACFRHPTLSDIPVGAIIEAVKRDGR